MSEAGFGYPDLDQLMKDPEPLRFTFEILSINDPGQYKKDAWAMNDEERRAVLPTLKEEGNKLYQQKEYEKAAEKYAEALGCLENLTLHEKPNSPEYIELDNMRIPFLLNYAQCKLLLGEYYQAIEHCNSVIEKDDSKYECVTNRQTKFTGQIGCIHCNNYVELIHSRNNPSALALRVIMHSCKACQTCYVQQDLFSKYFLPLWLLIGPFLLFMLTYMYCKIFEQS